MSSHEGEQLGYLLSLVLLRYSSKKHKIPSKTVKKWGRTNNIQELEFQALGTRQIHLRSRKPQMTEVNLRRDPQAHQAGQDILLGCMRATHQTPRHVV
jgi:hypothetical protein